jgi:hypothetical protein
MIKKFVEMFGVSWLITTWTDMKTQCANFKFWTSGKINVYATQKLASNKTWLRALEKYGFGEKKFVMNLNEKSFLSNFNEWVENADFAAYFYRLRVYNKIHLAKSLEDSTDQKTNLENVNKSFDKLALTTSEEEIISTKNLNTEVGSEKKAIILSNNTSKPYLGDSGELSLVGVGSIKDYIYSTLQWVTSYYCLLTPEKTLKKISEKDLIASQHNEQYKIISSKDVELIQQINFFGSKKSVLCIDLDSNNNYIFTMVEKQEFYKQLHLSGCSETHIDKLKQIDTQYDHLTKYGIDTPINQLVAFQILNSSNEDKLIIEFGNDKPQPQVVVLKIKPGHEISTIDAFIQKILNDGILY